MKLKVTHLNAKHLKASIMLVAIVLISYGCVPLYRNVPHGLVNTPGVTITAVDGSFVLKYGETFSTPFSSNRTYLTWTRRDKFPKSGSFSTKCSVANTCAKVRVTVPGKKKPLYGYLLLSQMHRLAIGPGSRSYLIEIPQRYIDEASGGRVSVVYEWVTVPPPTRDKQTGWVLWLSDAPF